MGHQKTDLIILPSAGVVPIQFALSFAGLCACEKASCRWQLSLGKDWGRSNAFVPNWLRALYFCHIWPQLVLTSVLLFLKFPLAIAIESHVKRGLFDRLLECPYPTPFCPPPPPRPLGLANVSDAFLCRLVWHIGEAEELKLVCTAGEVLFICWTFTVDMCNHALPFLFFLQRTSGARLLGNVL